VLRWFGSVIRWFRSIATAFALDDPAGSGRAFGIERSPERVIFFSDAVFAIAVTLLVLDIRPPEDTRDPADPGRDHRDDAAARPRQSDVTLRVRSRKRN
jgi:hypothetical protein